MAGKIRRQVVLQRLNYTLITSTLKGVENKSRINRAEKYIPTTPSEDVAEKK